MNTSASGVNSRRSSAASRRCCARSGAPARGPWGGGNPPRRPCGARGPRCAVRAAWRARLLLLFLRHGGAHLFARARASARVIGGVRPDRASSPRHAASASVGPLPRCTRIDGWTRVHCIVDVGLDDLCAGVLGVALPRHFHPCEPRRSTRPRGAGAHLVPGSACRRCTTGRPG